MLSDLLYRLRALFQRKAVETELDEELRYHVDREAEKYRQAGASAEEAMRRARIVLGGPEQVKEECRDARGTRWVEDFWQDLRYALRTLRQRPGFAMVALLTLALGVGATTLMFSIINGVLLKPLPYEHGERLLMLSQRTVPGGAADKAGLREGREKAYLGNTEIFIGGDLIIGVDDQPVTSPQDLAEIMNRHEVGDSVVITFMRGRRQLTAKLVLGEAPGSQT